VKEQNKKDLKTEPKTNENNLVKRKWLKATYISSLK